MNTNRAIGQNIKLLWPDAHAIRFEGSCDCCHAPALYSFQLPCDHPRHTSEETCGYFCTACGFSNAGSRAMLIIEDGNDHELATSEGPED